MSVAKIVIEVQEHSIARIRAGTLSSFWLIQLYTKNTNISKLCI
jgi:tRNA threonylcarbamoyladenosine modification (KEOPS) complex  Pcc1 subunit